MAPRRTTPIGLEKESTTAGWNRTRQILCAFFKCERPPNLFRRAFRGTKEGLPMGCNNSLTLRASRYDLARVRLYGTSPVFNFYFYVKQTLRRFGFEMFFGKFMKYFTDSFLSLFLFSFLFSATENTHPLKALLTRHFWLRVFYSLFRLIKLLKIPSVLWRTGTAATENFKNSAFSTDI